ncbi:MAG: DUF2197 domain-containing protein [Clostridia bacterium]|nr:DUF2197 domain-containing protein [Clostridia bacterium]
MEVQCSICGKKETITKIHGDYFKIAREGAVYICENCSNRLRSHAMGSSKPKKPM